MAACNGGVLRRRAITACYNGVLGWAMAVGYNGVL